MHRFALAVDDVDDVATASTKRRASLAWIVVLLAAAGAALIARTTEELRIPCAFGKQLPAFKATWDYSLAIAARNA